MKYEIELSDCGKEIFKGGNIEVMKKPLMKFEAHSDRGAEHKYNMIISEMVGSASFRNYKLTKLKG